MYDEKVGILGVMSIDILHEEEDNNGWLFHALVRDKTGTDYKFEIRLSWVDYNHWSTDGSDRPEAVAKAALAFILSKEPAAEIAERFDVARIRRRYPDSDVQIPLLIR